MASKGRNFKAVAIDVAEGFVTINPIFLKPLKQEELKELFQAIERRQVEIRSEAFPYNKVELIRKRNLRLQRLYTSQMMIKTFARERRIILV